MTDRAQNKNDKLSAARSHQAHAAGCLEVALLAVYAHGGDGVDADPKMEPAPKAALDSCFMAAPPSLSSSRKLLTNIDEVAALRVISLAGCSS